MIKASCAKEEVAWSQELQSAFVAAQKMLSMARAITLPRLEDQLWSVTDGAVKAASLGSTLYITCKDIVKVAGYVSAKLRPNQTSWLPCEVETLSIAAAVKHFSPYIAQSLLRACIDG